MDENGTPRSPGGVLMAEFPQGPTERPYQLMRKAQGISLTAGKNSGRFRYCIEVERRALADGRWLIASGYTAMTNTENWKPRTSGV